MPAVEIQVLRANQTFYDAFGRGDMEALESLWSRRAPVACVLPGWDALHGREEVMAGFRSIFGGNGPPSVRCLRPSVYVLGETAFVICGEILSDAELCASNFFVHEEGAWRMVFHQAGPVHRHVERKLRPSGGMLN